MSPYLIKDQSLNEVIAVRAIDLAGNVRVEQYTPPPAPKLNDWQVEVLPYLAIIGVAGFTIFQIIIHLL